MANRAGRRRFGWVRELPSGRFQASYWGPDGQRHNAPQTFAGKPAAERWLSLIEAQLLRDEWINPERGKITPRRISGVCAPHQRRLAEAIKQARNIVLIPFATSM